MRRSEAQATFLRFQEIHSRFSAFLSSGESEETDFDQVKSEFGSLLGLLSTNLELFSEDQREFIINAKRLSITPRHRLGVAFAHVHRAPYRDQLRALGNQLFWR